ncbi:uncharacterized protein LOC111082955 [Drosophila obscura]|uniref:uncharacterized protein LOC111082955 n=1 Tax=Drosophila obscura TaxID=7282 RepID=UPI000B9FB6A4|nr:uncharacterized protein LOC111082955 [Drosophila obscura]
MEYGGTWINQEINPSNFGCPTTEGSDLYQQYMGMDPVYTRQPEVNNGPQQDFYGYGDVGYRSGSPMRQYRYNRAINSRNGLHSPMELASGNHRYDYCTSLPGIGQYEVPNFQPGNTRSPWKRR